MRTLEEIQRAHDLLHAVLEFDAKQAERMPKKLRTPMHAAHDVLSWVLEDCCGPAFGKNLVVLEEKMKAAGYRFVKRDEKG